MRARFRAWYIVLDDDGFERAHIVDVANKGELRVAKLTLDLC